ncbi:MAG: protein-disulfide reductase DsbD family protein, partial [Paucibacter sp.]|nr:protein-disulfide reductase DsbD family protein [Roseateles sp.]
MMRLSSFASLWHPIAGMLLLLGLWVLPGLARADDFLDPEQAFKLSVKPLDERSVEVRFDIAPGYYMYREQFKAESAEAKLAALDIPKGKVKFDETFQKEVEIYREALVV